MKSDAPSRPLAFEPAVVLLISAVAATFYGIYLLKSQTVGFHTFRLSGTFLYVVPIVVPFVAFLLDRAEHINETLYYRVNQQSDSARPTIAWGLETTKGALALRTTVDVLILIVAIGRAVANVPFVSGHTLFLSYAIFSSRSRVVVVTATLVMLHVVYLKYFVWHDAVTSTSGIVLGCLTAYLVNRFTTSGRDHRDG